ncbi:MAG: MATE family efflux transporter, partial [Clostridia bacterium]|nr:MATE family efflux transporter [Clostridia bacterium]
MANTNTNTNTLDMTQGRPAGLLVRFAVPLLLCSMLQAFYSLVDSLVVGRLLGVDAFAAIGASWFTYWLLLSTIMGLSHGFGTVFAQRFGAKNLPGLRKAFATA